MNDSTFEFSLTSLTALALLWIMISLGLATAGILWINVSTPLLVFLSILIGMVVLVLGGGTLLYFWGKSYMARG